jgi:hypothetical protein
MRRSHGLFRQSDAFFRLQFSADYTITMFGFDFRQGQGQLADAARKKRHRLKVLFTALVQTAEAEHIPRELTFGGSELGC